MELPMLSCLQVLFLSANSIFQIEDISAEECLTDNILRLVMGRLFTIEHNFRQNQGELLARIERLEEQNKQLNDTNFQLQKQNEELNRTIQTRLLGQASPAFVATMTTSANFSYNVPVIFDATYIDIANNYNNSAGTFKARIPGRYLFSVSAISQKQKLCHPGIYKNGVVVVYAFSGDDPVNWSSSASVNVVLDLDVDDEVSIRGAHPDHSGAYVYGSFTGVLLYPF